MYTYTNVIDFVLVIFVELGCNKSSLLPYCVCVVAASVAWYPPRTEAWSTCQLDIIQKELCVAKDELAHRAVYICVQRFGQIF